MWPFAVADVVVTWFGKLISSIPGQERKFPLRIHHWTFIEIKKFKDPTRRPPIHPRLLDNINKELSDNLTGIDFEHLPQKECLDIIIKNITIMTIVFNIGSEIFKNLHNDIKNGHPL